MLSNLLLLPPLSTLIQTEKRQQFDPGRQELIQGQLIEETRAPNMCPSGWSQLQTWLLPPGLVPPCWDLLISIPGENTSSNFFSFCKDVSIIKKTSHSENTFARLCNFDVWLSGRSWLASVGKGSTHRPLRGTQWWSCRRWVRWARDQERRT